MFLKPLAIPKPVLWLGALLVFGLLLGCAPCCLFGGGNSTTGSVTGTFFISANGVKQPVSQLAVTVGASKTTTDSNGYFNITGLAPGTYTISAAGGDLGYSGKVTVVAGQTTSLGELSLHPTLPPPNTAGTTGTTNYPDTAEAVIRAYYAAVNTPDYSDALRYLAEQLGAQTTEEIRTTYEPYVKNIKIVKIERKAAMDYNGRSIYIVTFTADYLKHYPAGNGNLPTVHALKQINGQWKIVDIGTG
jgi:hypothetical protein